MTKILYPIPKLSGSLVAATHNSGKFRELVDLLTPYPITLESAQKHGLAEPEETGSSFAANAVLKARHAAQACGLPALADDSGLCVEALFGDPGIFSARWAGPKRDFTLAMQKIAQALERCHATDYSARFVSVLSLAQPDGTAYVFEGQVQGHLVFPGRGTNGFGYDPIFVANGHKQTFGEMDPVNKHAISHRADAFAKLVAALF